MAAVMSLVSSQALIDSHSHLHFGQARFCGHSFQDLVARAKAAGVAGAVVCATNPEDWSAVAAARAEEPAFVRAQFGVHPWWLTEEMAVHPTDWESRLRGMLSEDATAGVGETGLDKSRRAGASLDAQRAACLLHLAVAADMQRPVTLHCVRAYGSLLDLLRGFSGQRQLPTCVLHGYAGPLDLVRPFARLGCRFSIGAGTSEAAKHADMVRAIPPDRLLLETDAPDQAPAAVAATAAPNEPAYLPLVCAQVAAILGTEPGALAIATAANARAVFWAPPPSSSH